MALKCAAVVGAQPDVLSLVDQVADGEDQSVFADDDAVALTQRAKRLGGEGLLRHVGCHGHDGIKRGVEIEREVLRLRLQTDRNSPLRLRRHILLLAIQFQTARAARSLRMYDSRERPDVQAAFHGQC